VQIPHPAFGSGNLEQNGFRRTLMTTFPKSLKIVACEHLIKSINEVEEDDELWLPVDTAKYAFGGLASAIQAAITWGRKSNSRKIMLRKSQKPHESQINEVINRPHKFTAAMLSKSILIGDAEHTDLRTQVNLAAKSAIEHQEKSIYGQQNGRLCWFAFVDHSSKGFDRNFYIDSPEKKPELRQPAQIQAIIRAMVEKSSLVAGGGKLLDKDDQDHLGRIFYELFLNTHEHGSRGNTRSEWIKPGMRVIYTYGINLKEKGVEGMLLGEPVLTSYLDAQDPNFEKINRFIEISIIDSGLGYCGRWLADNGEMSKAKELAIEEEYDIFKKCFTFRQTSSLKDNKGHGLPVVMDRLTRLKGFIRIRSGRLALFRDFISNPYKNQDECEFSDWISMKVANLSLTEMPRADGVAITLLIPLESKK
jgi:hypothetical protein